MTKKYEHKGGLIEVDSACKHFWSSMPKMCEIHEIGKVIKILRLRTRSHNIGQGSLRNQQLNLGQKKFAGKLCGN